MAINPDSRMRKARTAIHGWKADGKFYTSLRPRLRKAPKNEHASASDALQEASKRHVQLVWEDPAVIS